MMHKINIQFGGSSFDDMTDYAKPSQPKETEQKDENER